jgi:hypothetical protein
MPEMNFEEKEVTMGNSDVIEQWLNTMSTGRSEHKQNLQMFLDFTGKSAQQILDEYKASSKKQFKNKYSQSLLDFTAHLRQQNFEPNEIRKKTESARLFFKHNKLPLGFGARAHLQFLFK